MTGKSESSGVRSSSVPGSSVQALSSVRSFIVVFRSAKGDYRTVIPRTILSEVCE